MPKSAKGREINMEALRLANPKAIALGNARMNAKGDLLGKGGKVLKTREELAREYHKKNPNAVRNVPLSEQANKMFEKPKTSPKPPKVEKEEVKKETVDSKGTKKVTKKEDKKDEKVAKETTKEETESAEDSE